MAYPKPDQSDWKPNFEKTPENEKLDLGWYEGALSDGRPFRADLWAQDQCTCVTVFFSTRDMDELSPAQGCDLLEREGLVQFLPASEFRSSYPVKIHDGSHNEMWSLNVVLDTEYSVYANAPGRFRRYTGS